MNTNTQMKPSDVVKEHFKAIEEKNFDKARSMLTDDFKFNGMIPQVLGMHEYIETHRSLLTGLPDWSYHVKFEREAPDRVVAKLHITGTHTRDLRLPIPSEPGTIQATGKKINLPEERVELTLRGNKIAQMKVEKVPNGGIPGILTQLGAHLKN